MLSNAYERTLLIIIDASWMSDAYDGAIVIQSPISLLKQKKP